MKIFDLIRGRSLSKKMKTQLIASFVIISFIIMATVVLLIYINVLDILKKQNEQSSMKLFRQSEYNIDNLMNEVDKVTKLILVDNDFQSILEENYDTQVQKIQITNSLFSKLSNILNSYEYIKSIYVYEESGLIFGVSNKSYDFVQDTLKENKFFHSKLYKKANNAGLSLVWDGLYTEKDFNMSGGDILETESRLITTARRIRPIGQSLEKATLVINIDEERLTAIYNNSMEEADASMYIINDSGVIISHLEDKNIDTECTYFSRIDKLKKSGSITIQNPDTIQVVYYKLNNNGWTLISEVPEKILLKNVISFRRMLIFIFLVSTSAIFILSVYWIYRITKPLDELVFAMKTMESGKLGVTLKKLPHNDLGILGSQFNRMSLSIAELLEKNKLIEEEKRIREMEALQMQINPHFLYNTLNTIKWMSVVANVDNITESITILGNILRPIFKEPSLLCLLREEVDYISNYLKIMNLRYSGNIGVKIRIQDEIMEYLVLRFILQPLIENSITHGISDTIQRLEISLTGHICNGDIFISVEDNGQGMSEKKLNEVNESLEAVAQTDKDNTRIGLTNVNRRIKLNFGSNYGICVQSTYGKGSKITLVMPAVQKT